MALMDDYLKCSYYAILRLLILFYECLKADLHAYKVKKAL